MTYSRNIDRWSDPSGPLAEIHELNEHFETVVLVHSPAVDLESSLQLLPSDWLENQRFDFVDLEDGRRKICEISNQPDGDAFFVKRNKFKTTLIVPSTQLVSFAVAAD